MIRPLVIATLALALFSSSSARADEAEFIKFEPGKYQRGESDQSAINRDHPYSVKLKGNATWSERPRHWVILTGGFEMARTEVTVGQFSRFVEATGYQTDAERNGTGTGFNPKGEKPPHWMQLDPKFTWKNPGFEQNDDHPVVCVSWNDAQAYCRWLSTTDQRKYRLPTEAEWEYAARAGTQTWYSWGNLPDDAYRHANVADAALERLHPETTRYQRAYGLDSDECSDGHAFTAPTASFTPNPAGLHDMHGNAWEWCQDIWQEDHYAQLFKSLSRQELEEAEVTDPSGPQDTEQQKHGNWRVLRGGGWYTGPISARSAMRSFAEAGDGICYVGFRVVRDSP